MHDSLTTVASPDVCQQHESSVTLCPCGNPAKKKYCSDGCRQKAYRTSAAFLANKERWKNARMRNLPTPIFKFPKFSSGRVPSFKHGQPRDDSLNRAGENSLRPLPAKNLNGFPPLVLALHSISAAPRETLYSSTFPSVL
jgi:CDGSH-type Zn-finger protein